MANEIQYNLGESGRSVYAVARDGAGQAWNGAAFVGYSTSRDDFDIPLAEIGVTGHYGPTDLPGTGASRWWEIYLQAGSAPSHADDIRLAVGYYDDPTTAAIKAKTNNLPADPASQQVVSDIASITELLGQMIGVPDGGSPEFSVEALRQAWDRPVDELTDANLIGGRIVQNLDGQVSQVVGGGLIIPVSQVPVPLTRTWVLKETSDGWSGELPLIRRVGENQPFAVDFRNDLPNNGRLVGIDAITVVSGPDGGIVIGSSLEDRGVDRSQAKFRIELLQVGTYVIEAQVIYDGSDGGGTSIGSVTLIVRPSLHE